MLNRSVSRAALAFLFSFAMSCASDTRAARGEACTRSLDCKPGLACVERVCGTDLSSISDMNTVPQLMADPDAGMLDVDGAVADGAAVDDAGR